MIEPKIMFIDYDRLVDGVNREDLYPSKEENLKPIIFVGINNLPSENEKDGDELYQYDQRRLFFDSSIWCHYIKLDNRSQFQENLNKIANRINRYKNIYNSRVALEHFEFMTRLYENSYLVAGEHSTDVVPFKFHSEQKMNRDADELVKKLSGYKWRILVVDDFADKRFNSIPGMQYDESEIIIKPTKIEVLKNVLGKDFEKIDLDFVACKSIEELIIKLTNKDKNSKIFDIILLDYLLDEKSYDKKNTETEDHDKKEREYSTAILKWIKGDLVFYKPSDEIHSKTIDEYKNLDTEEKKKIDNKKIIYNPDLQGPLDKFWFFPISVFSYAFMEDIRQMGYTQYDDDWVIARGADPVNTPELFRYSLFKFMEAQLNDAGIKLEEAGRSENNFLIDFLIQIFADPRTVTEENLKENYKKFLDKKHNFEILYKDFNNNSLFAKSVLKVNDNKRELKAFYHSLDHFHHLYYLMAFTSPYEWPMMRAEYDRIETEYANQGINITNHPLWEKVFELIKNYREIAGSR